MTRVAVLAVALVLLAGACDASPIEPVASPSPIPWIETLPAAAPGRALGPAMYGGTDRALALGVGTVAGRGALVTAGSDGLLRVWDLDRRKPAGEPIPTGQGVVDDLILTRWDGKDVAVASGDTLRVWDLAARRPLTPPLDTGVFSGRMLAVGEAGGVQLALAKGESAQVQRWDLRAGRQLAPLRGMEHEPRAAAIGRSGGRDLVVAADDAGGLRSWDLGTGASLATARTSISYVTGVAVVDGAAIITGADGGIERWDLATGAVAVQVEDGDGTSVELGVLDGRPVELIGREGVLQVADAASGKVVGRGWDEEDLLDHVAAVGHAGGRRVLAVGDLSGSVSLWDLRTGERLGEAVGAYGGPFRSVGAAVVDGVPVAVTSGDDDRIRFWDLARHRQRRAAVECWCVEFAPMVVTRLGGRPVAVVAELRGISVRDVATGRKLDRIDDEVYARARLSADGPVVAAVNQRREALLWDLSGEGGRRTLDQDGPVEAVAVGLGLAATSVARGVQLWDQRTAQPRGKPIAVRTAVEAMALGRVGGSTILFTLGRYAPEYGFVRLWDTATGRPYGRQLAVRATAMAVTRVGTATVLVTGHQDGTVVVWDPATMEPLVPPFSGHAGSVNAVAVTTVKGKPAVVSAGEDGSVRVWDLSAMRKG